MIHFLFASIYMPLAAILACILVVGLGGHGTWHRLPFFDGYAQFLITVGREIYDLVAGRQKQPMWSKALRYPLAFICRTAFSYLFMVALPLFMIASVIAMCINRK